MKYDQFIDEVQKRARLQTREEAIQVTRAVLETLGERLDREVVQGVAAQLPNDLKDYLKLRSGKTDVYNVPEFYNRVGARADLKYYDSAERTWQVMGVLKEAIPEGELRQIVESLPAEYGQVFGDGTPYKNNKKRPKP
jgi:uncharacterized protein (DUF2267 family)